MDDLISRQDTITEFKNYERDSTAPIDYVKIVEQLPSAQPERVWTPCDIPPEHHKDVIVRGIEPLGNVTVHKIMQWDVDRWRPEDYAPSVIWLDWSEI